MTNGLKADKSKCTGCQLCGLICSVKHVGKFNPSQSRIEAMDVFPEPGEYSLDFCIQCDEHPCVEACPAEAIKLDEGLGIYVVDKDMCTACGSCVEACPHSGIWLDPTGSIAMKCDLCGGTPECVAVCPKGVLKR
jgi:Fe-S-cluster-containing hydrogenase component 2